MTTAKDTWNALQGIKSGLFEGFYYKAEWGWADDDLPNRWEIVFVDFHREHDLDWEYRLYRSLNPKLFKETEE